MKKTIGIIGSGSVGKTLAAGFYQLGYPVTIGSRDPKVLQDWCAAYPNLTCATFAEVALQADIIILAVKGDAAAAALELLAPQSIANKTIIDTTNPIASAPPVNGVLPFFTGPNESLMERLQKKFPQANFVKAFNSVGNAFMIKPPFATKPTMFICGNDDVAKQQVRVLLADAGWEAADMGKVESARAIEPLCMLWCIPGLLHNKWQHAFKLLDLNS